MAVEILALIIFVELTVTFIQAKISHVESRGNRKGCSLLNLPNAHVSLKKIPEKLISIFLFITDLKFQDLKLVPVQNWRSWLQSLAGFINIYLVNRY